MADRLPMRDVIFLLPGIGGSVLTKDDREIWAPSVRGVWELIKSGLKSFEELMLNDDDPLAPDLGDGVKATKLVDDIHIIPGLWKIDGYSAIRNSLARAFELYPSSDFVVGKTNYVEFPYDWRRDNRANAARFATTVDRYLYRWRQDQNLPGARAILLAHSMGGLVARYWLEVLGGWKDSRALVTFGTPHRGSPKALEYLVNGYKPSIASLTSLIQSCTSIYQLLPIYPVLSTDGKFLRVADAPLIARIEPGKAADALEFHRAIESSVNQVHLGASYALLPMVGTQQSTLQSAVLAGGEITPSLDLPKGFDPLWTAGDGTVPYVSAIPIEMSREPRLGFICEQHGSIQNNRRVLEYLYDFLKRTQTEDMGNVREAEDPPAEVGLRPGLTVEVEDFYAPGETPLLTASLVDCAYKPTGMSVRVERDDGKEAVTYELIQANEKWVAELAGLPPGAYRATVRASIPAGLSPTPVTGLFEVAA